MSGSLQERQVNGKNTRKWPALQFTGAEGPPYSMPSIWRGMKKADVKVTLEHDTGPHGSPYCTVSGYCVQVAWESSLHTHGAGLLGDPSSQSQQLLAHIWIQNPRPREPSASLCLTHGFDICPSMLLGLHGYGNEQKHTGDGWYESSESTQPKEGVKKIFGDDPIPQYEVNPRTTEILYHLAECNRAQDRDAWLVIEGLKQKANEYESEAKHLQDLLMESVNFSPADLSSTGSRYLNALVDSAMVLETKDTSLASFIPAVNDLTSDLFRTKSRNEELQLQLGKLEKNLTATSVLEKCLRENLKKAELHLSTEKTKVDNRLQDMDFLKAKAEEFRFGIRAAEEQLSARGMDASLSHQSQVALAEKLAELKRQTIPLKKRLESYLDLMLNPSLAQVKIEEAKRELDTIETELTKKVDMMEL
ncbi:HAUS augmin-like complex subunit 1 [Heterocephalus glaber]|uniref:HAUS augmin-like complex subunit 1 n=1 Tax=Heterocephalus glaber TaxID=10181 RepID=G5B9L7_HETGA|nr:HAUS augmin-like complex subunit 1 [Heterocephalus glaber]